MASTLEQIGNGYSEEIKERATKNSVMRKKMESSARNMQNAIAMQLGDDGRVDEAVMISFCAALFSDITKAFQEYKKISYEKQLEDGERSKNILQEKLDSLKKFQESAERSNRYTRLKMEQAALEKKSSQDNTPAAEKKSMLAELKKIGKEIDKIVEFYGKVNEGEYVKSLEKAESLWYGDGAEFISKLRGMSLEDIQATFKEKVDIDLLFKDEDYTREFVKGVIEGVVDGEISNLFADLAEEGLKKASSQELQ
ncbi:MAG: hypothetical protein A3F91_09215 [Flavobacteria bacterium RIFCSPLOWO2_12_FULL_35_11]|nr:MAG: hypothetical protein A3F91_09215 [Flavobacteria bacterium RIFCSPLOWO2_12_FULL_35_11]